MTLQAKCRLRHSSARQLRLIHTRDLTFFICMSWLIYMCIRVSWPIHMSYSYSYVIRVSWLIYIIRVPWLIHMILQAKCWLQRHGSAGQLRHVTNEHRPYNRLLPSKLVAGVTWLICTCGVTYSYVWHDSFMCAGHEWALPPQNTSQVWDDSFVCVIWFILLRDVAHLYVWRDSFIGVMWLIHLCDVTRSCVWRDWFFDTASIQQLTSPQELTLSDIKGHAQIHIHAVSLSRIHTNIQTCKHAHTHICIQSLPLTHSYVCHDSIICLIWRIHMCVMIQWYMWRHSFTKQWLSPPPPPQKKKIPV